MVQIVAIAETEARDAQALPPGWAWTTLGTVALVNWRDTAIRNLPNNLPVTFVPMAAVDAESGSIQNDQERLLLDVRKGFTPFLDGDILFAKITPCMENGKAAIAKGLMNGRGFGSTEFHVLRPETDVLSEWLFYFVRQQSFREDAKASFAGTAGQLRVPTKFLHDYPFPLPPLAEQRRIVAAVETQCTRLDAGVAALKRVRAALKRYRAAVLKAAAEGRLTAEWRAAQPDVEPAATLLDRIAHERRRAWEQAELARYAKAGKTPPRGWQDKYREPSAPDTTALPELPKGWCWTTLSALAELKGGITKGQQRRAGETLRAVPYLRVANVQRGFLDLREIKFIEATEAEIDELKLLPRDILFNEGGDRDKLGRGWIWNGELDCCIHQNHVFRARLYLDDLQAKFISWYGNSFGQQYFISQGKQTTNLASINLTKLGQLPVPLPPLAEQEQIVAEVERRLSVVAELEAQAAVGLKRAERLRQSILAHAFAGRLVPQDPADEPASALLERIRAERSARQGAGSRKSAEQPRLL